MRDFGRILRVQCECVDWVGDGGAENMHSGNGLPRFCVVSVSKEGVGGITEYRKLFGYRFSASINEDRLHNVVELLL